MPLAQLVERRIVIPDVAGSSPVGHPILKPYLMTFPSLPFLISANVLVCEKVLKEQDRVMSAIRVVDVFECQTADERGVYVVAAHALVSIKTNTEYAQPLRINLFLIDSESVSKPLFEQDLQVDPQGKVLSAPGGVTMQVRFRVELCTPGVYRLAVAVDGHLVAQTPLTLRLVPTPEPMLP